METSSYCEEKRPSPSASSLSSTWCSRGTWAMPRGCGMPLPRRSRSPLLSLRLFDHSVVRMSNVRTKIVCRLNESVTVHSEQGNISHQTGTRSQAPALILMQWTDLSVRLSHCLYKTNIHCTYPQMNVIKFANLLVLRSTTHPELHLTFLFPFFPNYIVKYLLKEIIEQQSANVTDVFF